MIMLKADLKDVNRLNEQKTNKEDTYQQAQWIEDLQRILKSVISLQIELIKLNMIDKSESIAARNDRVIYLTEQAQNILKFTDDYKTKVQPPPMRHLKLNRLSRILSP
jgi:hypothetical protein